MTASTDVAVRDEQPTNEVAVTPTGAVASLAHWANEARAAHALAVSLCATDFVPRHFRGKPAEATAAILTGHELGMSPMASLRSIFVIGGTPGMYAKALVAIVQAQGHEVWVEEQSDDRVIVCGRRKGSEHAARVVWDRERVVKAKLLTNAKYTETPQQMMVARGSAEVCRQIAPDALLGIPYAVEELRDLPPERNDGEPQVARVTADEILADPADEPITGEIADEAIWPEAAQPGGGE